MFDCQKLDEFLLPVLRAPKGLKENNNLQDFLG